MEHAAIDQAAARLREAAERLAVAAAFERVGVAPAWARAGAAAESAARLGAWVESEAAAARAPVLKPMESPLTLSYSLVNAYGRCPACLYVEQVLGLGEQLTDAVSLGGLVHTALEEHARAWRDAEADGRSPPGAASLAAAGRRLLAAQFRAGGPGDSVTADELAALLGRAHDMMAAHRSEILEVERRISMPYALDGVEHMLVAKLDRVDRTERGVRIVDYKTGAATKAKLEPGKRDLQLGIYAMVIRHEMPDVRGTAEYWLLRTGERGVIDLDEIDLTKVRAEIDKAARAMLAGDFPRTKGCGGPCALLGEP
jgi:RecB family exonuclease